MNPFPGARVTTMSRRSPQWRPARGAASSSSAAPVSPTPLSRLRLACASAGKRHDFRGTRQSPRRQPIGNSPETHESPALSG
jgi:hypothetical protein